MIGVDDAGARISGGSGDDTIVAGLGLHQILAGGGGNDTFTFLGRGHQDTISDFDPATDKIRFQPTSTGGSQSTFNQANAKITVGEFRGSTIVNFDGNAIALTGVRPASLAAGNFILPPGDAVRVVHSQHAAA